MKQTIILFLSFCVLMGAHAQISGSLDPTFGANGKVITSFARGHDQARAVLVQADGKIVAAGLTNQDANISKYSMALTRYNTDGTLDNTFGTNGQVATSFGHYGEIKAMTLQNDGKIIAVGQITDSLGRPSLAVVRYLTNGTLDTTFGSKGKAATDFEAGMYASAVTLQNDGKIVVTGTGSFFNGRTYTGSVTLMRYWPNGVLDTTFNRTGKVNTDVNSEYNDIAASVTVQPDDKIAVCGATRYIPEGDPCLVDPPDLFLIRYTTTGSLDSTFAQNGIIIEKEAAACTVKALSSGKLLVAGHTEGQTYGFQLRRFNSNGLVDATFNFDAPTYGTATDMLVQMDGKIILVGNGYYPITYEPNFTLFRCHADGGLDNTFGTNGKVVTPLTLLYERYGKIAQQSDGKILACGHSKIAGQFNFNVIRYNNTLGNVGTKTIAAATPLMVYPNPMQNTVTIAWKDVSLTTDAPLRVRVVDVAGRIVLSNIFETKLINDKLTLDVTHLATGAYILEVTSADKRWTRLMYKQ